MPLIQFKVYFREYVCMLMIMVHTPDGRENRLVQEAHPAVRRIASLIWVLGRLRSLKIASFDRSYALYDFLMVGHCKYSSILYHFLVIWRWVLSWPWNQVKGHSRSLKLVPFESLGTVFHSHFIATVTIYMYLAICETFLQRQRMAWPWKMGACSRSLKVAPFLRPYTTFYWSAIVNMALFCTIFELFGVE